MPSWTSTQIDSAIAKAEIRQAQAQGLFEALSAEAQGLQARAEAILSASALVRELSLKAQTSCQERIASVVTRCLESVFGESKYRFKLLFEEKRNQTEARCVLLDAEGNEYDPLSDNGGGVVDVVCFGLRLACLMLIKPRPERVLILDEPFQALSAEYRPNLIALLEKLCNEFQMQVIMVTHIPELATRGHSIEL